MTGQKLDMNSTLTLTMVDEGDSDCDELECAESGIKELKQELANVKSDVAQNFAIIGMATGSHQIIDLALDGLSDLGETEISPYTHSFLFQSINSVVDSTVKAAFLAVRQLKVQVMEEVIEDMIDPNPTPANVVSASPEWREKWTQEALETLSVLRQSDQQ